MKETITDLENRRSCRKYTDRQIDEETLNTILTAAAYAPSGMGKQSAKIVVTQNPEIIRRVSKLNAAVMGRDVDPFYGAPALAIVFADRNVHTYVHDGVLVAGNLMNAAYAMGVDSCYIFRAEQEFECEEGKKLLEEWGIGEQYAGIANIILGYRDEGGVKEAAPRKEDYIVRV